MQLLNKKPAKALSWLTFGQLGAVHAACKLQILDQLAEEVHEDDLKICKMDVDENPNTDTSIRYYVNPNSSL